jgi:hypothetical protein
MLTRRSQKDRTGWDRINRLADQWLPKPRILHPWPNRRFAVKHPRWEPDARMPTSGSVRGVPSNGHPYRNLQGDYSTCSANIPGDAAWQANSTIIYLSFVTLTSFD